MFRKVFYRGVFFDGTGNTKKPDSSKGKKVFTLLLAMIFLCVATGCDTGDEHLRDRSVYGKIVADKAAYVDFERFKEGRPCAEVKFMCLPESLDKSWQNIPTKDHIEDFELTPEVMKKRQKIIQLWRDEEDGKVKEQDMRTAAISEAFYDRVEEKRFLMNMEQSLEKEFPGFWRDVPKKVRYRWIRRAMNKAKRFGGDPKQNNEIVELCARIGLDFDQDPKWKAITQFVAKDIENNLVPAVDYIDWTIFDKTHDRAGTRITDWSMRDAHPGLPAPKKPYPPLHQGGN